MDHTMSVFYCEYHGKSEDSDYVGYHCYYDGGRMEICDDAVDAILDNMAIVLPNTLPQLYATLEDLNRTGSLAGMVQREKVLERIELLEDNPNHHE